MRDELFVQKEQELASQVECDLIFPPKSSSATFLNSYDLPIWASHKNSEVLLSRSSFSRFGFSLAPVSLALLLNSQLLNSRARS